MTSKELSQAVAQYYRRSPWMSQARGKISLQSMITTEHWVFWITIEFILDPMILTHLIRSSGLNLAIIFSMSVLSLCMQKPARCMDGPGTWFLSPESVLASKFWYVEQVGISWHWSLLNWTLSLCTLGHRQIENIHSTFGKNIEVRT